MLLRSSPLLLREGGHTQWPGKAGSTGVAGVACSAAFGLLKVRRFPADLATCNLDDLPNHPKVAYASKAHAFAAKPREIHRGLTATAVISSVTAY